jgi:hypothetical protein
MGKYGCPIEKPIGISIVDVAEHEYELQIMSSRYMSRLRFEFRDLAQ